MFRWTPFAMVRITAFLASGIVAAILFPSLLPQNVAILLIAVCTVSYLILVWRLDPAHQGIIVGCIGLTAVTLMGYELVGMRTPANRASHFMNSVHPIQSYVAAVRSVPEAKAKSWKIEIEVQAIKTKSWLPAEGKVMLYVARDSLPMNWKYGDRILVKGSPVPLKGPSNPGEFDYKRFLSFRHIYHQQFVRPPFVQWLASADRKGFMYYALEMRVWASQQIQQHINGSQAQAVASALVLGVTDGLDSDLLNAYAASGAMHVLAVSGLHVGIIYGLLLLLLKPFSKMKGSAWLIAGTSLLCLWGFAFVTGLSPSVLRAVTMFSFVALAKPFSRRTTMYNTLAASAFALLLYNPYLILSVGFQLSYGAVVGIVYLQRPIYQLWNIRSRVGDWVWQITCVSLAAQIATFSLGLLYFHQFPVYFLVSNLFVIPLSTAVLVLGIVLLSFSFVPPVAWAVGKLMQALVYLLNQTVYITEQLPYSLINDIHISTSQCWLLIGMGVGLIITFEARSLRGLYFSFLCGVLFSVLQWNHWSNRQHETQWVVYAINGHSAMDFISQGQAHAVVDPALAHDEEKIRFHIRPNRLEQGVALVETDTVLSAKSSRGLSVARWENKIITHVQQPKTNLPVRWYSDYLVVSHNAVNIRTIRKEHIGRIVLDGTNTTNYCNKLIKFAAERQIPVHVVLQQGAFILTLSR